MIEKKFAIDFGGRSMAQGRRSEDKVLASKLMVLERICEEPEGISISKLAKEHGASEGTIKKYVEYLSDKIPIVEFKNRKVRVLPSPLEEIWSGTPIGPRLVPSESKRKLAKKDWWQ